MIQIYTNISKDAEPGKMGTAMYIPQFKISIKRKTFDHLAVLFCGTLVLLWVEEVKPNQTNLFRLYGRLN